MNALIIALAVAAAPAEELPLNAVFRDHTGSVTLTQRQCPQLILDMLKEAVHHRMKLAVVTVTSESRTLDACWAVTDDQKGVYIHDVDNDAGIMPIHLFKKSEGI